MVDDETREQLRRRYGFAEWARPANDELARGTEGLLVAGTELGVWRALRVDPVIVPGARLASRSMWRSEERSDALLSLELIETTGAEAAREMLVQLLGEFQSPEVERQAHVVAGDVAFTVPGETAALFARANVVAMVRNAGRELVPVGDFALRLDDMLTHG